MNWADFFSRGLTLTGSFNLEIGLLLFLLSLIGEAAAVSVPYLLETTWLLAGYQFSAGVLPFHDLLLMVAAAMAGRQIGEVFLYWVARGGSKLLGKYANRFKPKKDFAETPLGRLFHRVNLKSPFSVALGRLLWVRIPLTLIMAAQGRLKTLMLATFLSSLVYDGTFIALGAIVGKTAKVEPFQLILFFMAILTGIYAVTFVIHKIVERILKLRHPENATPPDKV
jgi:membrane-associated protein